jgi:hypothetical protein
MLPVYPLHRFVPALLLLLFCVSAFALMKPQDLSGTWEVTETAYGGPSTKPMQRIIKVYGPKEYASYILANNDSVPLMRGSYTLKGSEYREQITWVHESLPIDLNKSNQFSIKFLNNQKFVIEGDISSNGGTISHIIETWEKVN